MYSFGGSCSSAGCARDRWREVRAGELDTAVAAPPALVSSDGNGVVMSGLLLPPPSTAADAPSSPPPSPPQLRFTVVVARGPGAIQRRVAVALPRAADGLFQRW